MSTLTLGRDALHGMSGSEREWLVTNGIGGFASSSLSLMNTRRYHGLLFASLRPPVERVALVSKIDVTAVYGNTVIPLAANEFADGTIAPRGFCHLESFRLQGLIPVWTWAVGDARVEQRLWMRHGQNTTYVQFTRLGGSKELRLNLEPLCTYRDYHWQPRGERAFRVDPVRDGIEIIAYDGAKPYRVLCADARIEARPQWHWNFKHRDETARGLDDIEDLFRPAIFEIDLSSGQTRTVILTAESQAPMPATEALSAERARQREISARYEATLRVTVVGADVAAEQLVLAADQFLVERRDALGTPLGRTVIAGYPWFSDWGRDTMIALPGLTLATGREEIAVSVLRTFARFVSQGMLPNRFPDAGETPEYNTVDASLWFFVAIHAYLTRTGDRSFQAEIYPTLKDMLDWHIRGTRFGIQMDPTDGLLRAGENGVQLTWMDAKVGDWVITPRIGKPVEINALWFNAVSILRDLASELGASADAADYAALASRIRASFEQAFWFDASGYLYDVIDGPEGAVGDDGRRRDGSLRPNQIFALSLPYALLIGERAERVLAVCAAELWTPVGLRSLAPSDSRYVRHYGGGPIERDGAYHQGTVWTWLLGPFASAHYRIHADAPAALEFLRAIPAHLREGCIGQVSEIMDANAPFEPRGCFAQAWGVAEILRAWSEINECENRRQTESVSLDSSSVHRAACA
ncbi:MAG TPA: amylo-alpha-1,6-glucosidase [Steroidobacteraceae bacterium]|nr:amylo-alpha-1,6-glucosidase [Steroidobacteraceae bacterium]